MPYISILKIVDVVPENGEYYIDTVKGFINFLLIHTQSNQYSKYFLNLRNYKKKKKKKRI